MSLKDRARTLARRDPRPTPTTRKPVVKTYGGKSVYRVTEYERRRLERKESK